MRHVIAHLPHGAESGHDRNRHTGDFTRWKALQVHHQGLLPPAASENDHCWNRSRRVPWPLVHPRERQPWSSVESTTWTTTRRVVLPPFGAGINRRSPCRITLRQPSI